MSRNEWIRAAARRLLSTGRVDRVLGFCRGSIPLRDRPFVARTIEEVDRLCWTGFCTTNPAKLLLESEERTAVVAQGCVSRNIAQLIQENRIARPNLHIIGVPCEGMIDREKALELAAFEIVSAAEEGEALVLTGRGNRELRVRRSAVLRPNCRTCLHMNPVLFDELAGEPVEELPREPIGEDVAEWEALPPGLRRERFRELIRGCIRCYACRDACPLCTCALCFVDDSRPQWCGKTQDEADVATFHILRAFHCAGRCTDCGACESACPQGIRLRILTSKLEKDVRDLYGYEPGLDTETLPPLCVYRPDDAEEFVK
jgi:formate dehydrogenase (coenzyme F420) beta subunit